MNFSTGRLWLDKHMQQIEFLKLTRSQSYERNSVLKKSKLVLNFFDSVLPQFRSNFGIVTIGNEVMHCQKI